MTKSIWKGQHASLKWSSPSQKQKKLQIMLADSSILHPYYATPLLAMNATKTKMRPVMWYLIAAHKATHFCGIHKLLCQPDESEPSATDALTASKLLGWQTHRQAGVLQLLQENWLHDGSVSLALTCAALLLWFTKRLLSIHNEWPASETLPLCLNVTPKCLLFRTRPPVDGYRKEKINTFLPGSWPFQEIFVRLMVFCTLHPSLPPLCSIKEPGFQPLVRWLFWDISLPSSAGQPAFWIKP